MTGPPELPPAVAALLDVGIALARRAPSAQLAIARLGDLLDPDVFVTDRAREAFLAEVAAAREATCTPIERREVERLLRDAWRSAPAKVLDELDPEPLAVRPAAQVHRGELDGRAVAIKVRRPGVERAVRTDLALLEALPTPLRAAFPKLDAVTILRDARETALDELDFEHEASQQRRVARALRGIEGIEVPRPHLDHSTTDVLVTDLADGLTLADGAVPADPDAAARALVAAFRAAALDAGLALVDPRPTHVVVQPDGTLALLGTGVARPVDRDRAAQALDALAAVVDDDADAFAAAAEETGVVDAKRARAAHGIARDVAGPFVSGPATLDTAALQGLGVRALKHAGNGTKLAMAAAPQPDDLALGRMLGQLVAVLSRIGATLDWRDLAR